MIRGEPAIGRDQSREPRLYSVEPVWGADHEAVIRFCGQGSEAAGPFSQRLDRSFAYEHVLVLSVRHDDRQASSREIEGNLIGLSKVAIDFESFVHFRMLKNRDIEKFFEARLKMTVEVRILQDALETPRRECPGAS